MSYSVRVTNEETGDIDFMSDADGLIIGIHRADDSSVSFSASDTSMFGLAATIAAAREEIKTLVTKYPELIRFVEGLEIMYKRMDNEKKEEVSNDES